MTQERTKTHAMQLAERDLERPLEEALREMYHDRRMRLEDIGAELKVDTSTVSRWMSSLGIDTRRVAVDGEAVA